VYIFTKEPGILSGFFSTYVTLTYAHIVCYNRYKLKNN